MPSVSESSKETGGDPNPPPLKSRPVLLHRCRICPGWNLKRSLVLRGVHTLLYETGHTGNSGQKLPCLWKVR